MSHEVLVIGAGPAGIASAYYLQQAGIPYRVIDRAPVLASTWANLYPSLRLNTTRFFSHLPGKRFPYRCGIFPTGRDYYAYLTNFVREHGFRFDLGVDVHRITPENDGWQVETSAGVTWHPAVISATGRFGNPCLPSIPGLDTFAGNLIHARDYHGAEPFAGQRVLVVGSGPSGMDLSIEIGKQNAPQHPALLAMRTGIILKPRYPLGLPKHAWLMLTERLPRWLGEPLDRWIESRQFRHLDRFGIKTPPPDATSTAASTRGPELIHAVRAGQVRCVSGLARLDAGGAWLDDGSYHPVDAVIMATGYRPVLDQYFDYPGERDPQDWPLRDTSDHPNGREVKGYPGLYLVGVFYKGKGAMFNFNVEAKIAVEQIQQRLARLRPPDHLPELETGKVHLATTPD